MELLYKSGRVERTPASVAAFFHSTPELDKRAVHRPAAYYYY